MELDVGVTNEANMDDKLDKRGGRIRLHRIMHKFFGSLLLKITTPSITLD